MDGLKPKVKLKREARRRRAQLAWIAIDGNVQRHECRLTNLSQHGAQIVTDGAVDIPGRFSLSLVPNSNTKKTCEVVWQQRRTFGIKFVMTTETSSD
jgi:PilZ domain